MHEQATRYVDLYDGRLFTRHGGQFQALDNWSDGRINCVMTKRMNNTIGYVKEFNRDSQYISCLVVHAEHQNATAAVGKRGKLIRHRTRMRRCHTFVGKTGLRVFQKRILPKADLVQQLFPIVQHHGGSFPVSDTEAFPSLAAAAPPQPSTASFTISRNRPTGFRPPGVCVNTSTIRPRDGSIQALVPSEPLWE